MPLNRPCPVLRAGRQSTVLPGPRCLLPPRTEVRPSGEPGTWGGGRLCHLEWDKGHSWIRGSTCTLLDRPVTSSGPWVYVLPSLRKCTGDPGFQAWVLVVHLSRAWLPWGWNPGSPVPCTWEDTARRRDCTCCPAAGRSPGRRPRAVCSARPPGPRPAARPLLAHSALPQVTEMPSVPRSLLPAPLPPAPGGAQPLRQSPAALSLRAEATGPGPALCPHPPGKAARSTRAATPAAPSTRGH